MRHSARGWVFVLALGTVLLEGCGGRPNSGIGFINDTQHSDAQLFVPWTAAPRSLSQRIDLNPLQRTSVNVVPTIFPGDSRVWNVWPRHLSVSPQADVSSATLYAAGTNRADPTGLISCPAPCNVNYSAAYSLYGQPVSRYAASWEFSGNNFDVLVEYEFENQIWHGLGYDMRWR
jgi:hypothetical protein